jgi:hypothetical protein
MVRTQLTSDLPRDTSLGTRNAFHQPHSAVDRTRKHPRSPGKHPHLLGKHFGGFDKHIIALRKHFNGSRKHFIGFRKRFMVSRKQSILFRKHLVRSHKHFIRSRKHFIRFRKHLCVSRMQAHRFAGADRRFAIPGDRFTDRPFETTRRIADVAQPVSSMTRPKKRTWLGSQALALKR